MLLLLAAPLLIMGVAVSWQDYAFERALPLGDLQTLRRATEPGARSAMMSLRDLVVTVARSPDVRGPDMRGDVDVCNSDVSELLNTTANATSSLSVASSAGEVWCASPTSLIGSHSSGQAAFDGASQGSPFAVSPAAPSSDGKSEEILAAAPVMAAGRVIGIVTRRGAARLVRRSRGAPRARALGLAGQTKCEPGQC